MKANLSFTTVIFATLSLTACTSTMESTNTQASAAQATQTILNTSQCIGTTQPPAAWASKLVAVDDPALLTNAIGEPNKGKLCQGQVYEVKAGEALTIYRAWNSTNPNSQFGAWWATSQPNGKVAQYREGYEICYQWSPLDKMTRCELSPGSKLVIGNGQSAQCSEWLTYPVSAEQQLYLEGTETLVSNCQTFDAVFGWE
ncbi:hypothetical protein [Photobacterium sp. 1_MG-2023]|uniref:hypothetical protein n=1 Tax=Photobacterium sp. 1_MG-2023 TaxID=3062646 RepID=UPI0026E3AA26|nr:hypothetical protein [Photobacterium sp. 1_MG-2023]MDO6705502.1 hypothetical protein [Photobacterium sp. 1_MG-2023]